MKTTYLFILLFLAVSIPSFAQSLQDIQNVKVDQLSNSQIEQLLKRAEATGLNEQQLIALARERGMPASEISKLQSRLRAVKVNNTDGLILGGEDTGREGITEDVSTQESGRLLNEQQKKIFGFSLFRNNKLTFSPNLNMPTPYNYVLGAGDQLLIDIYGASQQRYDQKINAEGSIFIPNVGPINLSGLTVDAATARLKSMLSQIYSGLAGNNPVTFLQVRVGNIRSIQVAMVGEIYAPGNYTLSSFSTVFNALYAAGGITEDGSFRRIKIYRNSKLINELDVYEFLINANQNSNIRLQDNDVIMIPPVEKRVEIQGPLKRPGLFELIKDESLEDLIKFAGGFLSTAYPSRAIVYRTTAKELKVENIEQDQFSSFTPKQGDNFIFGEILTRYENRVQVTGALMRPGTYALTDGMGIKDLISKAEGLREDAFLHRATLYRTKADYSLEIMGIDIGAVVRGEIADIPLMREDVLDIPSIYELQEEYYVKISGEINTPGAFAFGEKIKVSDLILRAGGFKASASLSNVEIVRRVKDNDPSTIAKIIRLNVDSDLKLDLSSDVLLEPFDHVIVRKSPSFRREELAIVEGEVFYPGAYAIVSTNDRISDLLQRSGGLTPNAFAKGATLIRRNEFFQALSADEIKRQDLIRLRTSINREGSAITEAEKLSLNRSNIEIDTKGSLKTSGTLKVDEFRKETIENILVEETTQQVTIRTTEMIGIDLEEIMKNPSSPTNLILKEGDVLSVPTELQTVRMRGEVLYPTTTVYRQVKGFRSYISNAGGFTEDSRKNRSYVIYANGTVKRTTPVLFFNVYPKVEPGAEIIVPKKVPKERMSTQAWIGLGTSMATLAIMIDRLIQ
jgi:protein involved in polysaccharide export with SLBB domain